MRERAANIAVPITKNKSSPLSIVYSLPVQVVGLDDVVADDVV